MPERRMFTMKIVDSDAFLDMPMSAQCLYFHLNMRADDDGFVNNPKRIQRTIGASDDDLKILIAKRFILAFENGVIVIKHWRMHNLLRKDRYTPTQYQEEYQRLEIKENGSYTEAATGWQPDGNRMVTQDRIGKDRIGKVSILETKNALPIQNENDNDNENDVSLTNRERIVDDTPKRKRFTPPSVDDVRAYCEERKNGIDPERFIDFYSARGWQFKNGQPVKDWKACMRTWEKRDDQNKPASFEASDLDKFINQF